jgi:NitT/TauT family transport system ATP-binding protein
VALVGDTSVAVADLDARGSEAGLADLDPSLIEIDGVSHVYDAASGPVHALETVDLTIAENEFVCFMGPSGCGKTTILNIVAGFLEPTSGTVRLDGAPISAPGPDRAMVFQDDAVFPWMTVEQNIAFSLRVRGVPSAKSQPIVDHYVDLVNLGEFRGAWPRQLSGGMRKRVDLARAYAADPRVLLLDEPFAALDVITKEYLQLELHRIWLVERKTVVFVTHDVEEAIFLADRVYLMSSRPGRIVATYEPGLPVPRDMSIKVDDGFLEVRKEIRSRMAEMSGSLEEG